MRAVVIGGHTRNIGKTAVMAGLIRGLKSCAWTAVKITQYGHGVCSTDGEPCGCEPTDHAFVLTEEKDPTGRSDTSRFLAAGAARALWLRVRQGQLREAIPEVLSALEETKWVMIESNGIIEFIRPAVYLVVLDSARQDFKMSARRFLGRADALVPVQSHLDSRAWTGLDGSLLDAKPWFPVEPDEYFSMQLNSFIRLKLGLVEKELIRDPTPSGDWRKE